MSAALEQGHGVQIPAGMTSEREWKVLGNAYAMKVLSVDMERHSVEVLVKVGAGTRSGKHRHTCETHVFVLEGRVKNHTIGCTFGPGDYCYQPTDDVHDEEFQEDTIAYVSYRGVADGLVEFYDADGSVCGTFTMQDFADAMH